MPSTTRTPAPARPHPHGPAASGGSSRRRTRTLPIAWVWTGLVVATAAAYGGGVLRPLAVGDPLPLAGLLAVGLTWCLGLPSVPLGLLALRWVRNRPAAPLREVEQALLGTVVVVSLGLVVLQCAASAGPLAGPPL